MKKTFTFTYVVDDCNEQLCSPLCGALDKRYGHCERFSAACPPASFRGDGRPKAFERCRACKEKENGEETA